jgi:Tol biopolymer transport system component
LKKYVDTHGLARGYLLHQTSTKNAICLNDLSYHFWKIVFFIQCLLLPATAISAFSEESAGHKFLVTSVRTGETEIFLVDPELGDAINLTRSPNSEERYPCWSPDGRQVAFTSNRDGTYNLYVMNADGSNVRRLTHLGKISCPAAWSPDGQWISFRVTDNAFWRDKELMQKTYEEKRGDKRPVWVVKADGSNPHIVEVLRYQCAIDGSRAAWKPVK